MPGKLDLTVAPWLPLNPTEPKAHGIYRDDPKPVVVRQWTDDTKTTPKDLSGGDWQAQIRRARITGSTASEPLAQFAVDDSDAANGVLVLSLTREQTRDLALRSSTDAFWDLQDEVSGLTLLTGKVRIFDDAGRPT